MFPKVEGETVVNAPLKSRLTFFAYICWAICAALAMRLAFRAGQGMGLNTSAGEIEMGNATTTIIVGLIETIPMMLFIFALFLLGAYFHGMTKKGVLTLSFATALEVAAGILMVAAVWTMAVTPSAIASVEAGAARFSWSLTDFSLGTLGVSFALFGLSVVMKEAVKKHEG